MCVVLVFIVLCQADRILFPRNRNTCPQEAALCGVHCLNTLLQGQFISEWDLAKIAHEFDALEANLMGQQGMNTPDYIKFAAEGSGNVARDGMFSIQV